MLEVHNFWGLIGYYCHFVEASKIARPLNQLTRKGVKFVWSEMYEASFLELKQKLVNAPILIIPKREDGFVFYTNVSH